VATLDVDMGEDASPEKKENKFPKNRSSPLNRSLSRGSKTGAQQSPQAKKMRKLFFIIIHSLFLHHFSPRPSSIYPQRLVFLLITLLFEDTFISFFKD